MRSDRRRRISAALLAAVLSLSMISSTGYAVGPEDAYVPEPAEENAAAGETEAEAIDTTEAAAPETRGNEPAAGLRQTEPEEPEEEAEPQKILPIGTESESLPRSGAGEPGLDPAAAGEFVEPADAIHMLYDDTLCFEDLYPGYSLGGYIRQQATSHIVSGGEVWEDLDDDVIQSIDANTVKAVGVGWIVLRLTDARQTIKDVTVVVDPAPLTVMMLTGQSNMEGTDGGNVQSYYNSVACKEGTVYSTYFASNDVRAQTFTGLTAMKAATVDTVDSIVGGSLTSSESLNGTPLIYPMNALTTRGRGKTGMDSGLAWEWNRKTGDKVYVINVAEGSSGVADWIPGGRCHQKASVYFKKCLDMVKAEVKAGHFVLKNKLVFWMQGEHDGGMSAVTYRENFLKVAAGFEDITGPDAIGIIMARNSSGDQMTEESIYMNGPRISQYNMAVDPELENILLVSNANERWVSDAGVRAYFKERYPKGYLTYPMRPGATMDQVPVRLADIHPDVHYSQIAHNENGITAADGMLDALAGTAVPTKVVWRAAKTGTMTELTGGTGGRTEVAVEVTPISASKKVRFRVDSETDPACISLFDQGIEFLYKGEAAVQAVWGSTVLGSLKVTSVLQLPTPVLKKAEPADGGITVTWNAVEGASSYRVYRKVKGGKWAAIVETTDTSYVDKKSLAGGTKYYYTVRCLDEDRNLCSDYNTAGVSTVWLATPAFTGIVGSGTTLTVKWNAVEGAVKYRIYRRTSSTAKWVGLTNITATQYKDTNLSARTTYQYTVRAISSENTMSDYDRTGISGILYGKPVPTTTLAATAMTVKWSKISGCSKYRVFYRVAGTTAWTKAATVSGTSCSVKGLTSGQRYQFAVRCMDPTGKYYAGTEGITSAVLYLQAPTVTVTCGSSYVDVKWPTQKLADKYVVYRKVGTGSWSKLGETTKTTWRDKSPKKGQTCYYTVRSYNKKYNVTSGYLTGDPVKP